MLLDVVLWLPGKLLWCLLRKVINTTGEYADNIDEVIKQYVEEYGPKAKGG